MIFGEIGKSHQSTRKNYTSIYELFDASSVVYEIRALLNRILHLDSVFQGFCVPHSPSAGGSTVAPADIAP